MSNTPPPPPANAADPANAANSTNAEGQDPTEAPVLLITAWHLPRMRSMPRAFYHVRRLDIATRGAPGCLWVHRWGSRRSLMLTTSWKTEADAHRWLNGASFARTADALREIDGAVTRIEQYRQDTAPDSTDAAAP